MYKVILRKTNREQRKLRVRKKIYGTTEMPRLTVFRSNKYIYAQLIDDTKGHTIVDVSKEVKDLHAKVKKSDAALAVGKLLAKKALGKKINKVVFDRNGYQYAGRVKSVAEGAREGGLSL
jgi:large subunit ribosomal protein L18